MDFPESKNKFLEVLKNPVALTCVIVITFLVACAVFGPALSKNNPILTSTEQFADPSSMHWFGTDLHGRDVFSRTLYGLRISLLVGLVGTLVSLLVGVTYGMVSGYAGGRVDLFLMRLVDILYSLPRLILVIVVVVALDRFAPVFFSKINRPELVTYARMFILFVTLGSMQWLTMARIIRGQVLSLKEQQFVMAAKSLGAGTLRILFRHLLPNLTGIIIVYLTLTIPEVILVESFLSFLGLGIQPPQASLGTLISDGAAAINPIKIYWPLLLGPGAVMSLALLSFNILGDHLRDAFDPRAIK